MAASRQAGFGRSLTRDEAVDRVASRLGVVRAECDHLPSPELLAEALRDVIFCNVLREATPRPVHIQTILNQTRKSLAPLWRDLDVLAQRDWEIAEPTLSSDEAPETDTTPIRHVLDILASIGDLHHVGNGYWLPTPIRLVRLFESEQDLVLVVGGAPLNQLRLDGYPAVRTCGVLRAIPSNVVPVSISRDDSAWQDCCDWLDLPRGSLTVYLENILEKAKTRLVPSHSELLEFEVYDPKGHAREAQYFRWTAARILEPNPSALVLCRSMPGPGQPRRHWLGRLAIVKGTTRCISESPLAGVETRRLQYALDSYSNAPTTATVEYTTTHADITLRSYVPRAELQLLTALNEECSYRAMRLPLRFRIHRTIAEPTVDRLSALGIRWH